MKFDRKGLSSVEEQVRRGGGGRGEGEGGGGKERGVYRSSEWRRG